MSDIEPRRQAAGLGGLIDDVTTQPKKKKPAAATVSQIAKDAAKETGFSQRATGPKVDGRTLRATGRSAQLNMSVKPETRERFWQFAHAHGFTAGEDALLHLLKIADDS